MAGQLGDRPTVPELAGYLWAWYLEIHSERPAGAMGPAPITRAHIAQWADAVGVKIERWEARALRLIDSEFLAVVGEQS